MNTTPQFPASPTADAPPANAIAVIGMAARFPGANSVSAFWRNLRQGHEAIVDLAEADLAAAGVPGHALANPAYVRRAALFDGIAEFDADFFGFTPQGARMMDPQHRLFLQCAWHALEDTGYDPAGLDGSVGVFGTSSASGYLLHNLMSHQDPNRIIGQGATFDMINLSMQNDKDYLATRIAHQFNLRGPALAVQTACSSSLVAVHLACQSILSGECDMALAGAASIRVPHHVGYWHEPGSMVSATGHCRPFDVRADGTVFGSGVAVLVLKAFHAAVADGDRIHAVIRGSAVNNDGSTKMTYAAPNAAGQAEVIAEAHAVAEVDAATISYVETHGTGTPLGDPIEIEGLRQAFELSPTPRSGPCVIGSVKSNIGHLEVASGIAGLVKTILCLEHRAIPATLHYTSPNPQLRLERSPFVVRREYGPWDGDGARRAGVSSFGVGGTNAHLVVEEAPATVTADVTADAPAGPQVLLLSARTAAALQDACRELAADLSDQDDDTALADVAHTLAGRRGETVRLAAVVDDRRHAAEVLGAVEHDNVFIGESGTGTGPESVAFTFPGQGAQHAGMARGLYESEPVFTQHFDLCAAGFADEADIDLRAEIFAGNGRNLEHTQLTQPALFAVEYALARLLEAYGVRPAAVAGHSIGEYAAATVAGVFDLPSAIKAVAMRARLMHAAPTGVMVAVALPQDALAAHLTPDVDIAAVNESGSCVVAGSDESIRAFQQSLSADGVVARRVRTSHAFHSRLMDAVVPEFAAFLSGLVLRAPRIPMLSNVTGTWLTADEATDPQHWARQIRATVRFADELGVLLADPARVLVEVGPGGTLTASAMRHDRWSDGHRALRLMRHPVQNRGDRDTFLLGLGQLWAAGVPVDWTPLSGGRHPRRVTVPGYPFDRQRHWVEHRASAPVAEGGGLPVNGSAPAAHTADGATSMEATLQRIWGQCLGLGAIDRSANFFEIGGDSLVAISVAMTAANEGLDLTPQDLYENQTVAALAAQLTARYASGLAGLPPADIANPPVPPNLAHALDNGVTQIERWRIPFLLRLRADVTIDDVRAVLTAVVNHHDALRLRAAVRAGAWEQHVRDEVDTADVSARDLPDGLATGSPEERAAVLEILGEQLRGQDGCPPLSATYIRGSAGGPGYLAISLHGLVSDGTSRDILLADLFTAFGQRLAGQDIALPPASTSWREWSQRCAALATHPAVIDSREYWLGSADHATLRIVTADTARPDADDMHRHATELSPSETAEIDEARRHLKLPIEDILLATLGRTVAATVGAGAIAVDIGGAGRSVLKPEVSLHRTVGWFTTVHPIALPCAAERDASARQLIDDVHETLKAVPHHGIGYGLLRHLYGPTARSFAAMRPADIHFDYVGAIPDLPPDASANAAVHVDPDTAMPVREAIPGLGHAIELRIYRSAAQLHADWWYDGRRVTDGRVAGLAQTYRDTLLELIREAMADDELGAPAGELTLIDLSSNDIGMGEVNAQKR